MKRALGADGTAPSILSFGATQARITALSFLVWFMSNQSMDPQFIYGTAWKEERTESCVLEALRAGFRAIDTANQRKHYCEAAVGSALAKAYGDGIVQRQELFLQTKFTHLAGQDNRLPYDSRADIATQVRQSFASSLEHLGTDYIDSYVLHGPSQWHGLAEEDWHAWYAMEELAAAGKALVLGVSNVSLSQLKELCAGAKVKPYYVQNRCFARTGWDREVREFCKLNGITYQGFSLLTANVQELSRPEVRQLAQQYRCSVPQLVFAFARGVGMVPLTGTCSAEHMREDSNGTSFGR